MISGSGRLSRALRALAARRFAVVSAAALASVGIGVLLGPIGWLLLTAAVLYLALSAAVRRWYSIDVRRLRWVLVGVLLVYVPLTGGLAFGLQTQSHLEADDGEPNVVETPPTPTPTGAGGESTAEPSGAGPSHGQQ